MIDNIHIVDYWEWVDTFRPIINHLDDCAAVDGYLFMNYESQWEFVKQFNNENIWSLIITDLDDGTTSWDIANGLHVVNREGFLLTEKPCFKEIFVTY